MFFMWIIVFIIASYVLRYGLKFILERKRNSYNRKTTVLALFYTVLLVVVVMNATCMYFYITPMRVQVECPYIETDVDAMVEWSDEIVVIEVAELEKVVRFNVLFDNSSFPEDEYYYSYTTLYNVKGNAEDNKQVFITSLLECANRSVPASCSFNEELEPGEVYIVFGSISANNQSLFAQSYFKLENYDVTKSMNEQNELIKDYISSIESIIE